MQDKLKDKWEICNLNLKCPYYWNMAKCINAQINNKCFKK